MDRKNINQIEIYDCAIIGGGIVGSGVFRDQSLHNKKTILIDQADFNSQTSGASSKMLHGGIRYLENFDFFLVFEALYEKNLWLKLAPHLAQEIPFYLPVYKNSKWPLFLLRIGLFIYDLLSLFKNTPHAKLNKVMTQRRLPDINPDGLKGAGLYYDGIVDDHKLGLECIYDGLAHENSVALNYKKVIKLTKLENCYRLDLQDQLTNKTDTVLATNVVMATGPFTDQTMKELNIPWEPIIMPSKGSHIWLKQKALKLNNAVVLQTKDGRVIFVIPQRDAILVGTTEVSLEPNANFKNLEPTQDEINYLLAEVNLYFPAAQVSEKDIIGKFAGVRPLVKDGHKSTKISRKHKLYEPCENLYVLAGGKYTTFRKMAQEVNKRLFKKMDWQYNSKLTLSPLKRISLFNHQQELTSELLQEISDKELVRTKEDLAKRRLSLIDEKQIDLDKIIIDKTGRIKT